MSKSLKPFDLEAAKRGEPLQTRDGLVVTEFHHFTTEITNYPCAFIVDGAMKCANTSGRALLGESESDLFMAPKKRTVWVNLYPEKINMHASHAANWHHTEDAARQIAAPDAIAVAVPVEIEV